MLRNILMLATIAFVIALGAILWALSLDTGVDTKKWLDREAFRCFSASESMRTIGYARHKRKTRQIGRIDLLLTYDLEALDDAKLRAERAILLWESEDARFLKDCAEAWYEPGGTGLRKTHQGSPPPMNAEPARKAFDDVLATIPARLRPHGFDERAALHRAEAALARGEHSEAMALARDHLKEAPQGLYTDSLQIVQADALLGLGDEPAALVIYKDVGRLRIGQDAQYARYRAALLLEARGDARAEEMLQDVLKWSERGARLPLKSVLEGTNPPVAP